MHIGIGETARIHFRQLTYRLLEGKPFSELILTYGHRVCIKPIVGVAHLLTIYYHMTFDNEETYFCEIV